MLTDCRKIAVIDTETNYDNEVMSIGTVIADACDLSLLERQYLILDPEYKKPAMFSVELNHKRAKIDAVTTRTMAIRYVAELLERNGVSDLFAYNAAFDCGHLPELHAYRWYDIMKIAAYKQYNPAITDRMPCCRTGKLKCSYGAESIYRMLAGTCSYYEVHNALTDAEDELMIMRMLRQDLAVYENARIN